MMGAMVTCAALDAAVRAAFAARGDTAPCSIPLLVFRLPEFAQRAWREGRPAARRLERCTSQAIEAAAARIMREGDLLAHDAGSEWFAIAMLAPAREGAFAQALDARRMLERITAAVANATGRRMEAGWCPLLSAHDLERNDDVVQRALERGARERERYEFLATLGHELRTPLTSIRGYVETVLDGDVAAPAARRFLEVVRTQALRLERLVDGMLDFSLLDVGYAHETREADLCAVARAAADAIAPIAHEASISVVAPAGRSVRARIDPDACLHALLNLLENAVKYGAPGGRVQLTVRRQDPFAYIDVDDDGPGIPLAERERIFAHRVRGSGTAAVRGAGIGLAIVRSIVERASGTVCAGSSPLGGARFTLRLPSARAESTALSS